MISIHGFCQDEKGLYENEERRQSPMGVSKYNREGYYDPTPHQAVFHMEQKQHWPLVYICSPYSGDVERNAQKAREYSRFAVRQRCIPLAPHLLFPQFLDDTSPQERELGLFFGKVLMSRCAEVWVFGSRITDGMDAEIRRANQKGQKVRYFTEKCRETHKPSTRHCDPGRK